MSTIPEDFLDILQATTLAHLATIGPKGEPQVSAVWFIWDGTHILISMSKERQKYRNLLREPRAALSIVDPNNATRSLEIRSKAVSLTEDTDYRINSLISKKYTGNVYTAQNPNPHLKPGEERVVAAIEPGRVNVFPFRNNK
ncbi:PPOX class F420-dependent oxidoreductase [Ktedonosporobacter rubrisoli]|uniref:PPOX class F420-dependent oxidoreductase n=1 Tax=Ktedonosporobacter rubrisoli TaxID=2509675 RepID=A0A4P6JZA7_KTERU|nr:PPOX class F420-dependent oxidoreductase [Ktedonosporobacter rubrisoli]QBD80832.1 PPOX class F420-dependent oxidoreductase [Ktedonosporobacter rubrisoli]